MQCAIIMAAVTILAIIGATQPDTDPWSKSQPSALTIVSKSSICTAISSNHVTWLKVLLIAGADPNVGQVWFGGLSHTRPLELAIDNTNTGKSQAMVKLLLDAGANPYICNVAGKPILFTAIGNGNSGAVQHLLEHGVSPHTVGYDMGLAASYTPLAIAASEGYPEIVQLLLRHGADPTAGIHWGFGLLQRSPRQVAISAGHTFVARNLHNAERRWGRQQSLF